MTQIQNIVKTKEKECFSFKPNSGFYKKVGINSRRWAQIYRGKIDPTIKEAKSIAQYFEVDVTELI